MSVKIRTVRTLTNVVRVWYGCADCGMYGNATVGKTWRPADYVDWLNSGHACTSSRAAAPTATEDGHG